MKIGASETVMRPAVHEAEYQIREFARQIAGRLNIATPSIEIDRTPDAPLACASDTRRVLISQALLSDFGEDEDALWIVVAHELSHIYWEDHPRLQTGLDAGFMSEDAADFTAGQLLASFGRNPVSSTAALTRVLQRYGVTGESAQHRAASVRINVVFAGWADFADTGSIR